MALTGWSPAGSRLITPRNGRESEHHAIDVLGGRAGLVEPEVMDVRLLEVCWKRPDAQRERIPTPVFGPELEQRAFDDSRRVRLRSPRRDPAWSRARSGTGAERLPFGEAHPELGLVSPVEPGVGIADNVAGVDGATAGAVGSRKPDRTVSGVDWTVWTVTMWSFLAQERKGAAVWQTVLEK